MDDNSNSRYFTRRVNPHERRVAHMSEDLKREDCATACLVASENRKDISTLFRRLDEERDERKDIKPGVPWPTFWVILVAFASLTYGIMAVMWVHLNNRYDKLEVAVQSISQDVAKNTGKVDVVVARINAFISANDEMNRRNSSDQGRIMDKLEEIGRAVQLIQVKVGKLEGKKGAGK